MYAKYGDYGTLYSQIIDLVNDNCVHALPLRYLVTADNANTSNDLPSKNIIIYKLHLINFHQVDYFQPVGV